MAPAYCQAHRSQLKSGTGAESIALILQFNNICLVFVADVHALIGQL